MAKLTLKNLQAAHDVVISFRDAILQFLVRIEAGAGGTVTPLGDVLVDQGGELVIEMTPDPGKMLDKILVDGVETAPDAE